MKILVLAISISIFATALPSDAQTSTPPHFSKEHFTETKTKLNAVPFPVLLGDSVKVSAQHLTQLLRWTLENNEVHPIPDRQKAQLQFAETLPLALWTEAFDALSADERVAFLSIPHRKKIDRDGNSVSVALPRFYIPLRMEHSPESFFEAVRFVNAHQKELTFNETTGLIEGSNGPEIMGKLDTIVEFLFSDLTRVRTHFDKLSKQDREMLTSDESDPSVMDAIMQIIKAKRILENSKGVPLPPLSEDPLRFFPSWLG